MTNPIGPVPASAATGSSVNIVTTPTVYAGPVEFQQLPTVYVDNFEKLNTTPSVANGTAFVAVNTAPTTLTDFLYGADGQTIKILGDGFTTVTHGTKIKTNTGVNKLLGANGIYTFTRFNNVWYEAV